MQIGLGLGGGAATCGGARGLQRPGRESGTVGLAVGIQRHGIQNGDAFGHHHVRQAAGQRRAEGLRIRARIVLWGDEGRKERIGPLAGPNHRHRRRNAGLRGQRRLDLAQLQPDAAQLDLMVAPPLVHEPAVGPPAHAVAGREHHRAGIVREGIGHKPFRREVGAVQIARSQHVAADIKLADLTRRQQLPRPVQRIKARVVDGAADGDRAVARGGDDLCRDIRRDLGRAVKVHKRDLRRGGKEVARKPDGQRLARGKEPAQRRRGLRQRYARIDHEPQQRRHHQQPRHAMRAQHMQEGHRIAHHVVRNDDLRHPRQQRAEDFPDGVDE